MENSGGRSKWFMLIIICALGAVIYTYNTKNKTEITIVERAEQRANTIAQELIEHQFERKTFIQDKKNTPGAEADRGLASATEEVFEMNHKVLDGEVGRDPWGNPYGFFVKGDGKHGSTLYIWSNGPNEKPDYRATTDLATKGASGDDILVVVPF